MTGFLKIHNSGDSSTTMNLEQVKYFYQDKKEVKFVLTTSGSNPTVLYKEFDSQEEAREYYNRLTEYLEITI